MIGARRSAFRRARGPVRTAGNERIELCHLFGGRVWQILEQPQPPQPGPLLPRHFQPFGEGRSSLLGAAGLQADTAMQAQDLGKPAIQTRGPAGLDGGGGSISAQTTSLTEAAAGVDFLQPLDVANGTPDLTGGISAIYGETETGGTRSTNQRGRVELGVLHRAENGLRTRASAYLDGLGAPGFQSIGAELMFELEF